MADDTNEFTIGSGVSGHDGTCGELTRVVVDPIARAVTHLVVEPTHPRRPGRLVPIDLVTSTEHGIVLRCGVAEFDALPTAVETQFLPGAHGQWGYSQEQMLSWPYFGLGMGGIGLGDMGGLGTDAAPVVVTHDRVPAGEVEVRRGDPVRAADGDIGRVRGLVVDPGDHHVTHVLLDEGHLWGRRTVTVPIGSVADVADGVRLTLTKDEVHDLPPVELDHQD